MPCPDLQFERSAADSFCSPRGRRENTETCTLPLTLTNNPDTLRMTVHTMLDKEGHQADYRTSIINFNSSKRVRDEVFVAKVGVVAFDSDYRSDTSFTQQMHEVDKNRPDAVIATYRSAVPILSAIQGYYDELGVPVPILGHVDVSRELADSYHWSSDQETRTRDNEISRLAKIVAGCNVVVIDEFLSSGSAISTAAEIAQAAGVASVRGIAGHWYRKIPTTPELYDPAAIKATYHTFMHTVGVSAAQIPRQESKPVLTVKQVTNNYGDFRF